MTWPESTGRRAGYLSEMVLVGLVILSVAYTAVFLLSKG